MKWKDIFMNMKIKNVLFAGLTLTTITTPIHRTDAYNLNQQLLDAVNTNKIESAKSLLKQGASANAEDGYRTVLHIASFEGFLEIAQCLIKQGADVNAKDFRRDFTPLHYAITNNQLDMAKFLIHQKADINSQSNKGYTPLMLAIVENNAPAVKLLLENCADANLRDNAHRSSLDYAYVFSQGIEIINLLKRHGAR